TTRAAPAVAALAPVVRVHLAVGAPPLPLDRSAELVRLADARGARPDLDLLAGKGMLIADVDTMIDPFQPTFFKGDGGYYDWIDVNHDGHFTPTIDAIDLDGDGKAGKHEVAQPIAANPVDFYGDALPTHATLFDPGIDWVYLDTNGNAKRDYGAAAGFDDTTPAFGEPLFTPDDVNRNGQIDVGERFVRLQTSKLRAIFVNLDTPMVSHVFTRGVDLAATQIDYTAGMLYGTSDAFHATPADTIAVGDLPLVGRRWVGMAPDADLVVAWDPDNLPTAGAAWALQQSPDVMLYELAQWVTLPLDGSDALSQMLDSAAVNDHVTNVCPTGDQGSARKHAGMQVAPGVEGSLLFDLPAHAKAATTPLGTVWLSVNVQGGTPASLALVGPSGDRYDLLASPTGTLHGGAAYYATTQTTPRAVWFADIALYDGTPQTPLDVGGWTLAVGAAAAGTLVVDAYLADDRTTFNVGAAWDASVASDRSTIGIPSVADHCIAVNAQPDHLDATGTETWYDNYWAVYDLPAGYVDADLTLRAYCPLGPRIDGVVKPDITAPDNPWGAVPHDAESKSPFGSFTVFGGTSGASPHVAGVAALLAQAGIRGDDARAALRAGAAVDNITGVVPNGSYGYGRLDAAGALGVTSIGADVSVTLAVDPPEPARGQAFRLVPTLGGDVTGAQAEWDVGYDGTWDATWNAVAPYNDTASASGKRGYKVRVRNASGHVAEAVAWIDVPQKRAHGCSYAPGAAHAKDDDGDDDDDD
ncbi:MAG TPA: S8 family serine peptidase, partial [Polyangia bacterium]|nr:S8 family serine peptidase [Polyangia bacterium]